MSHDSTQSHTQGKGKVLARSTIQRLAVVMVAVLFAGSDVHAGQAAIETEVRGSTYCVTFAFSSLLPVDSLLAVIHSPVHIRECSAGGNIDFELADSAALWNEVIYTYRYVIARVTVTVSRTLDTARKAVTYESMKCTSEGSGLVPAVLHVCGSYETTVRSDSVHVVYHQEVTLDRRLNALLLFFLRRDTRKFLQGLERYVHSLERRMGE
jgi:hypothetical protein